MKKLLILLFSVALVGCFPPHPKFAYRAQYFQNNPDVHPRTREAINSDVVITGMSHEEVLAAWGPPGTKYSHMSESGVFEEWVYPKQRLYFLNGKLKSITRVER